MLGVTDGLRRRCWPTRCTTSATPSSVAPCSRRATACSSPTARSSPSSAASPTGAPSCGVGTMPDKAVMPLALLGFVAIALGLVPVSHRRVRQAARRHRRVPRPRGQRLDHLRVRRASPALERAGLRRPRADGDHGAGLHRAGGEVVHLRRRRAPGRRRSVGRPDAGVGDVVAGARPETSPTCRWSRRPSRCSTSRRTPGGPPDARPARRRRRPRRAASCSSAPPSSAPRSSR